MALPASIYRADITVSDLDRNAYLQTTLTLARHPSETEERMMVRLLAFALYAEADLAFGRGLSAEDEPALCRRDATGAIDLWIDVGLPDERQIRRACSRARRVAVLAYGARRAAAWRQQVAKALDRVENLDVIQLAAGDTEALQTLVARSMKLSFTIQERHVWIASDTAHVELALT